MGTFTNVTMGLGALSLGGVDVGFLKNSVNYKYNYDIEDFKTGVPLQLEGSITKEVTAEITAGLAEVSAENFAAALGGLSLTTTGSAQSVLDGDNQERTFASYGGSGLEAIILDGPSVTGLVVKSQDELTTYTAGTDYLLLPGSGIVYRNPAGGIASGETVRVHYGYTQVTGKQVELGVTFSLATQDLVFVHTKPTNGKTITVKMWKAQASGTFEANFAEGQFLINNVTFKAVRDASHPSNPLGYILFET